MPIYKRCGRCGNRIPSGSTCPCAERYKKDRNKDYDRNRRDKRRDGFYHSREWKAAKAESERRHMGIDVYMYYTEGEIVPAEMVHHIEPIEEIWDLRLDIENMIPLSNRIHSQMHKLMREGKEREVKEMLKGFLTKWKRKENAEVEGALKLF